MARPRDSAGGAARFRIFLAVFPPAEVQRAAYAAIEALRAPGDGVSWVKLENLHYTLRFIGNVGADGLRRIEDAARAAAAGHAAFPAVLGGLGAFPSARRARVIWIGMTQGEAPLVALAGDLERALERRGFEPERQRFSAHLTIGRVRDPRGDWAERLARVALPAPPAFTVDRIGVIESKLSPRGSTYTVRAEGILGGAPAP